MQVPKVAVGIVSYGNQPPQFWKPMAENLASLYKDGIEFDKIFWSGASQTDINRNNVVHDYRNESKADWLWWIDADNPPPFGALHRLLSLNKPAVSGLYYSGDPKDDLYPIAYVRNKQGAYRPIDRLVDYEQGELLQVDAVGMGCFLTHRDLYDKIEQAFAVYQRWSGGLITILKDRVVGEVPLTPAKHENSGKIVDGIFYDPIVMPLLDKFRFPFFMSQWARTEDFPFCEMAREVEEIWLDTSVECGHTKYSTIMGSDYWKLKNPRPEPEEEVYV